MALIEIVVLVLAVVVLVFGAVLIRRRILLRGGGAVDMSLRMRTHARGRGWALGVGRYTGEQLQWFRVFALTGRPNHVLPRAKLEVAGQRAPDTPESWAVQAGAVVIDCRFEGGAVQIAMSAEAVTGFMSWLESSPPGYALPGHAAR